MNTPAPPQNTWLKIVQPAPATSRHLPQRDLLLELHLDLDGEPALIVGAEVDFGLIGFRLRRGDDARLASMGTPTPLRRAVPEVLSKLAGAVRDVIQGAHATWPAALASRREELASYISSAGKPSRPDLELALAMLDAIVATATDNDLTPSKRG